MNSFEFAPALRTLIDKLPEEWRQVFDHMGQRFADAMLPEVSAGERRAVATYFSALKLVADVQNRRPDFLGRFPGTEPTLPRVIEGLEDRERAYGGLVELFDDIPVPEAFRTGHNMLVKALRDFRAVDRRVSRELRAFADVSRYSEGETETREAAAAMNDALQEIVRCADAYYPVGVATELLSERPPTAQSDKDRP